MRTFILRYRTALLAAVLLGATPSLPAQDATQETAPPEPESFIQRFSFGGRLTVLGTNAMNSGEITRSTSEPPVTITTATSSESKRVGGGVTFEVALTGRVSLAADLLYKRAGYNRTVTRVEGVDDEDTTADERSTTRDIENTRADYWDLPITARLYNKARGEGGARAFLLGGVAFRRATAVRTVRELVRADGLSDTFDTPVEPAHSTVGGLVVGAGIQLSDELRFKFTPEVRFTRWMRSNFDNAPTASPKNQVEFVLGLTF